jgi:carbamoylphosphate synthase small subunit
MTGYQEILADQPNYGQMVTIKLKNH